MIKVPIEHFNIGKMPRRLAIEITSANVLITSKPLIRKITFSAEAFKQLREYYINLMSLKTKTQIDELNNRVKFTLFGREIVDPIKNRA